MIVLRKTMDAAILHERERAAKHLTDLIHNYGAAFRRVAALQEEMSAWVMNKTDAITPEQFAQMFYAQDDRWQAAFFNVMQAQVTAHHDGLPQEQVWGRCPGVPAGEGQWWHVAQHLDDSGFETLEAMYEHARSQRDKPDPFFASADTHPKDGDVKQAPLVSGAVPKADAQGTSA